MELPADHILLEELRELKQSNEALRELVLTVSGQVEMLVAKVATPPEHQKLTIREAAARLKRSERSFWRYVSRGMIEIFREEGRTYTTEAEVLKLERRLRS